ncbi:MAG: hypothetical protein RDV41_10470 [Planctomycetota bacterium]|nr:hypothetical protein [Planctomycetota bacterium]
MAWNNAEWGVDTGSGSQEEDTGEPTSEPSGTPTKPAKPKLPVRFLTQADDKKPCMIYFYFPTDKDKKDIRGKRSAMFEDRAYNDEEVARIAKYFNCYRLDVSGIEEKNLLANGVTSIPTVLITDHELTVLANISDYKITAPKLLSMIISTMQKKLSEVWKLFSDDRKKAEEVFDSAMQMMKEKKYAEALTKFDSVIKTPATALSVVKRAASQVETVKALLKVNKDG